MWEVSIDHKSALNNNKQVTYQMKIMTDKMLWFSFLQSSDLAHKVYVSVLYMLKVERLEGYTEVFGFEKALDAIELLGNGTVMDVHWENILSALTGLNQSNSLYPLQPL